MNIAIITDSFLPDVGGLEWKVHYLAKHYCAKGHEVTVFAQRTRCSYNLTNNLNVGYRLIRFSCPVPGMGMLGLSRLNILNKFRSLHQKNKVNIIHSHGLLRATQSGVMLKKKYGVPVVATPCGEDVQTCPEIGYGYRLKRRYDQIVRNNINNVDWIGCISHSVKKDILAIDDHVNTIDIPNGFDEELFSAEHSEYLSNHLGLKGQIIILSVGRYHTKKGYEIGVEAFSRLSQRYKNIVYVIVGRGVSALKEKFGGIERLYLVEEVPMQEVKKFFCSADIFLNPSHVEGFAQVNVQAMASGLPCVISDSPGNQDVGDTGGALLVSSSEPRSVEAALEQLVNNENLRQELGKKSLEASCIYSWDSISDQYLELFDRIVASNAIGAQ